MNKSLSIIIAASIAFCASCTKQDLQNVAPGIGNNVPADVDMDYIKAISPGTPSKTVLNNNTKVFWTSEDKLGVYSGANTTAIYESKLEESSAEAKFGRTYDNKPVMAGGKYYAVYPSSAIIKWNLTDDAAEVSGPFCTVNIPKKQTATVGSWDPKAALLIASSQTNQMAFKHGVSYVRFEVTEQTGNFVSAWLVAQNKEKLSDPQAVVEFGTSGEVLVTPKAAAVNYVGLAHSDAKTVFAPGAYYMAILPGEFPEGVTLYFSDAKGLVANTPISALTLNPGEVADLGSIAALTFAEGEIPDIDQSSGFGETNNSINPMNPFDVVYTTTKVSLVGDSITTYEGTLVTNFKDSENGGAYYPTGTVTSVTQQYWHKLINKMSNAVLDVNNSLRGSMVIRRTEENYKDKDYSARVALHGIGNPDVVFIHGGTNDCTKHSETYAIRPGLYRADMFLSESFLNEHFSKGFVNNPAYDSEAYKGMAPTTLPSDDDFNKVYAAAEAADTWEKVLALEDRTFIHAYVKLINMIHFKHPNAKVIMIIGDALTKRAQEAILKIADHYGQKYGYKCVNFFGATNISKVSGAHPDDAGFTVMADKIYNEVGTYIDAK